MPKRKSNNTALIQLRVSPGLKKEFERYAIRKSTYVSIILRQYIIRLTDWEEEDLSESPEVLPIKGHKE